MRKLTGAFLLVGSVTAIGLLGGAKLSQVAMGQGSDPYRELDTLAQALNHIEDQYLEPVRSVELIYGAIKGMTDVLDRHSVFLDPAALKAAQTRTEGVYSGIGIELREVDGEITIVRVVPQSPADDHIQRGEILLSVDGTPIDGLIQASEALRGQEGSTLHLKLKRAQATRSLTLVRSRIRDRTVRVSALGQGWAYAEIVRFQRNTASDLERGLRKAKPTHGVILDLRGNGGGLLEEAVSVVDLFAASGMIVQTRGRDGTTLEAHKAKPQPPFGHLKAIVLIDGDSASASEIVAGALRALCKATLVGSDSYGKWSVQRLYVFESNSAIKLTIAKYEIADPDAGTDHVGLRPDVPVRRSTQVSMAREALTKKLAGDDAALAQLALLSASEGPIITPAAINAPLSQRLTLDPQLKAAWTLARNSP